MNYAFSIRTDAGLLRENNEDSAVVDETTALAVLADGMGGYNAGEIASGMATAFIRSELGRWLGQAGANVPLRDIRRAMEICVDNANRSIFNAANSNPQYSGMGTTLVLGVFQGSSLVLGHVGDSRCYRLRSGVFTRLTRDHSVLQEQLDAGLISAEEAAVSVHKNLVTRALGVEDIVQLELSEVDVLPGDVFLMCSDGLTDMVADEAIGGYLTTGESLDSTADSLVAAANANGGRDNITVLLAQASQSMRKPWLARLLGK